MRVRVRRYRDADERAVLDLWMRAGVDRPWLDLRAEIQEKRRRDRSLFLVALTGDVIIGAVMGAYDGRRGWIYHLAVEPDMAGGGIGRALVTELERKMKGLGIRKVNLQVRADNRHVIGFYERLGYNDEHMTSMSKWLVRPSAEQQRKVPDE